MNMRLGGPVLDTLGPKEWAHAHRELGYGACFLTLDVSTRSDEVEAYVEAAASADLLIAEVGAFFSNPIDPDEGIRSKALEYCKQQLELADRVGARCCVNIAGSRGNGWAWPHPENYAGDTFDLIVESVRDIIDAVKPTRTFYTLETMPWIYPDSPQSYFNLIQAIDRPQFAVHLDPVNLINSPQLLFKNDELIRDCFRLLGPYIKSCHAKDITIRDQLTVHLDEVLPGAGFLDYDTYLFELNQLDPDTPLMLEHLSTPEEYMRGAAYILQVASNHNISIR